MEAWTVYWKRRKCWSPPFSPSPKIFLKALLNLGLCGKGLNFQRCFDSYYNRCFCIRNLVRLEKESCEFLHILYGFNIPIGNLFFSVARARIEKETSFQETNSFSLMLV